MKTRKPLRKRSATLTKLFKVYLKLMSVWHENPKNKICFCYGKLDCCMRYAMLQPHHFRSRVGLQLINVKDWRPCCRSCNGWIKEHQKEAEQKGWLSPDRNKPLTLEEKSELLNIAERNQ